MRFSGDAFYGLKTKAVKDILQPNAKAIQITLCQSTNKNYSYVHSSLTVHKVCFKSKRSSVHLDDVADISPGALVILERE